MEAPICLLLIFIGLAFITLVVTRTKNDTTGCHHEYEEKITKSRNGRKITIQRCSKCGHIKLVKPC